MISIIVEFSRSIFEWEVAQTSGFSFHAGLSYHLSERTQDKWYSLGLIPVDCGNVKFITDSL